MGNLVRPCVSLLVGLTALVILGHAADPSPVPKQNKPTPTRDDPSPTKAEPRERILFPPDHAVLISGRFDVICKADAPELRINGKPREWDPFVPPVHVARIRLSPGIHELQIGGLRRQVVVALNEDEHDGPPSWRHFDRHEMSSDADRCADCHEVSHPRNDRTAVGPLRDHEACFACHTSVDFDVIHEHPLKPIADCRMCHALHGSPRKALLKGPVKKLCGECHES